MASDASFMQHVVDQLRGVPRVTCRRMFGEYAVYAGGRVVALVCDNRLFLKPTAAGRAALGTPVEGPPYPGAKHYFVLDDYLDDSATLCAVVNATVADLPPTPRAKGRRAKKR